MSLCAECGKPLTGMHPAAKYHAGDCARAARARRMRRMVRKPPPVWQPKPLPSWRERNPEAAEALDRERARFLGRRRVLRRCYTPVEFGV